MDQSAVFATRSGGWAGQLSIRRMAFNGIFIVQAFLCFAIFTKNSKIQNGCHFWRDKNILKIGMATLQRYPVGQKYLQNRSI